MWVLAHSWIKFLCNLICRVFLVQLVKLYFHPSLSGHGFMTGSSYFILRLLLKSNISPCWLYILPLLFSGIDVSWYNWRPVVFVGSCFARPDPSPSYAQSIWPLLYAKGKYQYMAREDGESSIFFYKNALNNTLKFERYNFWFFCNMRGKNLNFKAFRSFKILGTLVI